MSPETTNAVFVSFIKSIAVASGSLISPRTPVPKMASIMTSERFKSVSRARSSEESVISSMSYPHACKICQFLLLSSVLKSFELPTNITRTSKLSFFNCKCRAATKASPPLFPFPAITVTFTFFAFPLNFLLITFAIPAPAFSISCADESPKNLQFSSMAAISADESASSFSSFIVYIE